MNLRRKKNPKQDTEMVKRLANFAGYHRAEAFQDLLDKLYRWDNEKMRFVVLSPEITLARVKKLHKRVVVEPVIKNGGKK